MLRKFPETISQFINSLENAATTIQGDSVGLAALVWILGEFGESLSYAPYLIEDMIENYTESESNELINALLLASCKLFFKTPGEMQEILGNLFQFIFNNFSDVDLKDRAAYYYQLMQADVEEAEFVICGEKAKVDDFSDNSNTQLAQIYKEFNTLSVLYNKPEEKFIKKYIEEDELKKEKEIKEEANPEVQHNQVEETPVIKEPKYEIITYNKSKLSGKAILKSEEFDELWSNYSLTLSKEFSNIPAEIDVVEFSKYLAGENIFTRSYKEEGKTLEMFLYSFDVSLINLTILNRLQIIFT